MYSYRVAQTEEERRKVLPLIKKVYVEQGYLRPDADETAFSKYLLLPTTTVFTGHVNNELFATLSMVPDTELGLPMDLLYAEELRPYRSQSRIAEVTQFAVDNDTVKKHSSRLKPLARFTSTIPLLRMVLDFALEQKFDCLVIAINPKHDVFYRTLGFKEIGGLKHYPSVNNAPALARILDLRNLDVKSLPGLIRF